MKKIMIVVLVLLVLGVGGYFYFNMKKAPEKVAMMGVANTQNTGGNVFTSIKDALSKSISLQCNFKDDKGQDTTTYIKAGSVRVVMNDVKEASQPNNVMMKDQKMYTWSDKTKEGFTFTLVVPSISPGANKLSGSGSNSGASNQDSVLATIEKYKNDCKPAVVSDSFFAVPSDIKFQDMSDFTKSMMKAIPTGPAAGSNADTQKYINQMMKNITPEAGDSAAGQ